MLYTKVPCKVITIKKIVYNKDTFSPQFLSFIPFLGIKHLHNYFFVLY